jgi:hypothetical protein
MADLPSTSIGGLTGGGGNRITAGELVAYVTADISDLERKFAKASRLMQAMAGNAAANAGQTAGTSFGQTFVTVSRQYLSETQRGLLVAADVLGLRNLTWVALRGGAVGALTLLSKKIVEVSYNMTQLGYANERIRQSFLRVWGSEAPRAMEEMRKTSQGMIDDLTLMRMATYAAFLGVADTAEEISGLMDVAVKRGYALGIDAQTAFERIVTGIGRLSARILDDLGILTDARSTYENYARSIGKSAQELTDAEKRQALVNRVLADGARSLTISTSQTEQLAAAWRNLGNAIAAAVKDMVTSTNIMPRLAQDIQQLSNQIEDMTERRRFVREAEEAAGIGGYRRALEPMEISVLRESTEQMEAMRRELLFGVRGAEQALMTYATGEQLSALEAARSRAEMLSGIRSVLEQAIFEFMSRRGGFGAQTIWAEEMRRGLAQTPITTIISDSIMDIVTGAVTGLDRELRATRERFSRTVSSNVLGDIRSKLDKLNDLYLADLISKQEYLETQQVYLAAIEIQTKGFNTSIEEYARRMQEYSDRATKAIDNWTEDFVLANERMLDAINVVRKAVGEEAAAFGDLVPVWQMRLAEMYQQANRLAHPEKYGVPVMEGGEVLYYAPYTGQIDYGPLADIFGTPYGPGYRAVEGMRDLLSTINANRAAAEATAALGRSAQQASSAINSFQTRLRGLIDQQIRLTQVTEEDMLATALGVYRDKPDEYIRRLRSAVTDPLTSWSHYLEGRTGAEAQYYLMQQERFFEQGRWSMLGPYFDRQAAIDAIVQNVLDTLAAEAEREALIAEIMSHPALAGLSPAAVKQVLGQVAPIEAMGMDVGSQFLTGWQATDVGKEVTDSFQEQIERQAERWVGFGSLAVSWFAKGVKEGTTPEVAGIFVDLLLPRLSEVLMGGRRP